MTSGSGGKTRRGKLWLLVSLGAVGLLIIAIAIVNHNNSFDYFGPLGHYAVKEKTMFLKAHGTMPKRVLHAILIRDLSARETADLIGQRLNKEGFERRHEGMDLGEEEFYKDSGTGAEYIDIAEIRGQGSALTVIWYLRMPSAIDNILGRISHLGRDPYISENDPSVSGFAWPNL